jgi:hypothetical protein
VIIRLDIEIQVPDEVKKEAVEAAVWERMKPEQAWWVTELDASIERFDFEVTA